MRQVTRFQLQLGVCKRRIQLNLLPETTTTVTTGRETAAASVAVSSSSNNNNSRRNINKNNSSNINMKSRQLFNCNADKEIAAEPLLIQNAANEFKKCCLAVFLVACGGAAPGCACSLACLARSSGLLIVGWHSLDG